MAREITDLYVPISDRKNSLAYPGPVLCYDEMAQHINNICDIYETQFQDIKKFRLNVDGNVYRATKIETPGGDYLALRLIKPEIIPLESIGFPSEILRHLRRSGLSAGGLVLVCGRSGNGKSTSCASIIVDRLINFGGVCNTIEYPTEFMLTGRHGESGLCLQRNVDSHDEFQSGISDALRSYPSKSNNILFIGEILDSVTATAAIKSAIDGHLVFSTMHAGSVIMALERIISLATPYIGNDEAKQILGSGLRLVICQSLKTIRGRTVLNGQYLIDTIKASQTIQNSQSIKHLSTELQNQEVKLETGQQIISRGEAQ